MSRPAFGAGAWITDAWTLPRVPGDRPRERPDPDDGPADARRQGRGARLEGRRSRPAVPPSADRRPAARLRRERRRLVDRRHRRGRPDRASGDGRRRAAPVPGRVLVAGLDEPDRGRRSGRGRRRAELRGDHHAAPDRAPDGAPGRRVVRPIDPSADQRRATSRCRSCGASTRGLASGPARGSRSPARTGTFHEGHADLGVAPGDDDSRGRTSRRPAGRSTCRWRVAPDPPSWELAFVDGLPAGWLAVTDPASRSGFAMSFDPEVFPVAWLWGVYGGWRGLYAVALEAWTAHPARLDEVIAAGRARTLAARRDHRDRGPVHRLRWRQLGRRGRTDGVVRGEG